MHEDRKRRNMNPNLLFAPQTLADQQLHPVCNAILPVRHLRYVCVLLAQAAGQRSRGGGARRSLHAGRAAGLPPPGDPDGSASRLHGGLLLPRIPGNHDNAIGGVQPLTGCWNRSRTGSRARNQSSQYQNQTHMSKVKRF